MVEMLKGLVMEEEGQGMTEYALVLGILAVGIVGILAAFRTQIESMFTDVLTKIGGTAPTAP